MVQGHPKQRKSGKKWREREREREGYRERERERLVRSGYLPVGGGLPCEGVGAKKFGMSLENQGKQILIGGISRDLAGISRGARKV